MSGARSHEELIVWQLAYELKLGVYELIRSGPITGDRDLVKQLRGASSSAPRLIAEGTAGTSRVSFRDTCATRMVS